MITTIKLPYTCDNIKFYDILREQRRMQTIIHNIAFNKLQKKLKLTQIGNELKTLNNINTLGSWLRASAFKLAQIHYSARKDKKTIFGGKNNLKQYISGKISKKQYTDKKICKLISIGEATPYGNRTVRFIDNLTLQVLFNRTTKFILSIPKCTGFYRDQIDYIITATKLKEIPVTFSLDESFIYISFQPNQKPKTNQSQHRIIAIDTNPNSIGWSVCDILDKTKVIDSGVIDLSKLNKQSKNKKHHETYEICKFLASKAIHYKCSQFAVEDLSVKSKQHNKGKKFNKLVNNDWLRAKLFSNLKKRCFINNIKYTEINPAYTSIIGGTIHRDYPDPIAPTLEIARRAMFKYQKGMFYPEIPNKDFLNEQWKQTLETSFESWREIADWLKSTKFRYRVSLPKTAEFYSLKHRKSLVYINSLVNTYNLCI